jgi:hypothetical protein
MALSARWLSTTLRTLIPGSAFQGTSGTTRAAQMQAASGAGIEVPPHERYALLRWYYQNNALYDRLNVAYYQNARVAPAMKGLRNPAYRIVEFYPAMLWPGDLPAALPLDYDDAMPTTHTDALTKAIHQTWAWSNWAQNKQTFARWLPMLGDCFIKVAQPRDSGRVYFELLDPANVIDFEEDRRNNVTECRIDIVREDRLPGGGVRKWLHVEKWSKSNGTYSRWRIEQQGDQVPQEEDFPPPEEVIPLASFGIDFVPIVHCKFIDVGELRGISAYLLQLDKIDNLNMEATRLAQLLYRHNRKVLAIAANDKDAANRPGAALALPDLDVGEDDEIMLLPGNATATTLLPAIDFEAHRVWITDGIKDLQSDCPELAYWSFAEHASAAELSGRALRYMLGPAIQKVLEVRGRAEDALARADMMALTLGQAARLPLFQGLGAYDNGDLDHTFCSRDVVPLSEKEVADTLLVEWQTAVLQAGIGVPAAQIFDERGYTAEQIKEMETYQATTGIIPPVAQ